MNATTILLVSRGTMSGGQLLGGCLKQDEGIRCVTREDLLAALNEYGDIATRVTAQVEKAIQSYEQFSELRRPYQILMRKALLEYARQGRLAYFGYSGHLLLDRVRHFVRIRLIAPMELRIARTRVSLGFTEVDAREHIHRVDQERLRWARLMYGQDIRDPAMYDLCLNIERLSMGGTCDLLRKMMHQPDFQPTQESIQQVEDLYLATQVLATLVSDPRTQQMELSATAKDGLLRLVGPYLPDQDRKTVLSIAGSTPGVRAAEYEPGYATAFGSD